MSLEDDASSAWAATGPIVRSYRGVWPRVHRSAWIAPGCVVVGDVEIGPLSSLWYGVVVRGDVHSIRIGARTNIQDLCMVHVTRDRFATEIGDEVTVGHRAVIHGCRVEDGALIGIGAVVLDGARVGEGALVGAGAVVTPGSVIGSGMLALGIPAREVRVLSDAERQTQRERTLGYVDTARAHAEASPNTVACSKGIGAGGPQRGIEGPAEGGRRPGDGEADT